MTKKIDVLDKGFVELVDCYGSDMTIPQTARISYDPKSTKVLTKDVNLVKYLYEHAHCYAPNNEVLTIEGWKRWGDCDEFETFLVPDPKTRTLVKERLKVLKFDYSGELYSFRNDRFSFDVTAGHRMFFKSKASNNYHIYKVEDMPRWGNFDPAHGYKLLDTENTDDMISIYQFAGFYLGDGAHSSANRICFHLKKNRKKDYLRKLLANLSWDYREVQSSTHEDGVVFWVIPAPNFWELVNPTKNTAEKEFYTHNLINMSTNQLSSLLDGLINSDGSIVKGRPQITFSSNSIKLHTLFQTLNAILGTAAHANKKMQDSYKATMHLNGGCTLESRGHFWSKTHHQGKVYCTTSSTGLLLIRGSENSFGFVCGNSSPFEQCVVTFRVKLPIFVARQIVRHRTARLNELSARYSEITDDFYLPSVDRMTTQDKLNRQGSTEVLIPGATEAVQSIEEAYRSSYATYTDLLAKGVNRETARIVLPLATYTEWIWQMDLNNMFKFLALRMDSHAQWETRQYAEAKYELLKQVFPIACEAFEEFTLNGAKFSNTEKDWIMEALDYDKLKQITNNSGFSERAIKEFFNKVTG